MLLLYTNIFKRYVIFIPSEPKGHEPTWRVGRCHTTPPTPLHPFCTAFSPNRLFVSWSSLSCLFFVLFVFRLQSRPAASQIQSDLRHGCCRALLPQRETILSNTILPGRSSPVRLRLTACGRPVGLPTTLTQ